MRTVYYIYSGLDDPRVPLPHFNAIFKSLDALVRQGRDAGYAVVMVSQAHSGLSMDDLRRVYGIEGFFDIVWTPPLKGVLRRRVVANMVNCRAALQRMDDEDILFTRYLPAALLALWGRRVCVEIHQLDWPNPLQVLLYKGTFFSALALDRKKRLGLLTISEQLATRLPAWVKEGRDVLVARSGVDDPYPRATHPEGPPVKAASGDGSSLTFLFTGTFDPDKGIAHIIGLANSAPRHRFIMVGGPKERIPELKGACEHDNVTLLERVTPVELPRLWEEADYCLMLNDPRLGVLNNGTSPLKLFEYMMAAKVVIATDMPAVREVVRDGENGVLVEPGDYPAILARVDELEANLPRKRAMEQAARHTAMNYTWDRRATETLRFFFPAPEQSRGKRILLINAILTTPEHGVIKPPRKLSETYMHRLAETFTAMGHTVTLVAAEEYRPVEEEEVAYEVCYLPSLLPGVLKPAYLPTQAGLLRMIWFGGYDVILSSEVFQVNSLLAALLGGRRTLLWHELSAHQRMGGGWPSRIWYNVVARLCMRRALAVPRSPRAGRFLAPYLPHVAPPVVHGVSLAEFPAGAERKRQFVVIAQLISRKGVEQIVASFARFVARPGNEDFRLRIMGVGPLLEKLRAQCEELGIAGLVDFLGHVSPRKVAQELAEAVAFLSASQRDLCMLSISEALACGTPVLTTSVPDMAEIVAAKGLGIVRDGWDERDMAAMVERGAELREKCMAYRASLDLTVLAAQFLQLAEDHKTH